MYHRVFLHHTKCVHGKTWLVIVRNSLRKEELRIGKQDHEEEAKKKKSSEKQDHEEEAGQAAFSASDFFATPQGLPRLC